MPAEAKRRRKTEHRYEIVVVPVGDSSRTKRFRASRLTLFMLGALGFLVSVAITLAFLIYTPIAMYVPIPNPGLEQRYGRQIVETQEKLKELAEDVLMLRTYNTQLRKALGDDPVMDSARAADRGAPATSASPRVTQRETEHVAAEDLAAEGANDIGIGSGTESVVVTGTGAMHSGFPLISPVEGFVSQSFDPARRHFGVDYAGRQGTPVCAAADGIVVFANWTYEDGNMVILSHGGGYMTVYKHNQQLLKSVHAVVKRGEPIALLGTSGKTSHGSHLHFEVLKDGVPRDPDEFLLTPSKIP